MKDIVIKSNAIKRELIWLGVMYIISSLLNTFAIIFYETEWSELYTSLGFVTIIAFLLYFISGIIRLISCKINGIFKSKAMKN